MSPRVVARSVVHRDHAQLCFGIIVQQRREGGDADSGAFVVRGYDHRAARQGVVVGERKLRAVSGGEVGADAVGGEKEQTGGDPRGLERDHERRLVERQGHPHLTL
jgi:hypothetical protein